MRRLLLILSCLTVGVCTVWAFSGAALFAPPVPAYAPPLPAPPAPAAEPIEAERTEPAADEEADIEYVGCGG